jgi:homocysteine S-methyltransferase
VTTKRIDLITRYNNLKRPLLLDGAMGTLLKNSSSKFPDNLWSSSVNLTNPGKVINLHKKYVEAGADIITSNTFRTNPNAFRYTGIEISNKELVSKSIGLCSSAIGEKEIIIAGSNAPAEDCYQKERLISKNDLEFNHKMHIEFLWRSGCDIIWNETQSHWDEIKLICEFCYNNKIPYAINLFFTEELKLLSGEPLNETIELINEYSPDCIGFNCIKPVTFKNFIQMQLMLNFHFGFYLNCGKGNVSDNTIECGINSYDYSNIVKEYFPLSPVFVGSCCGSDPSHTKSLRELIDELH